MRGWQEAYRHALEHQVKKLQEASDRITQEQQAMRRRLDRVEKQYAISQSRRALYHCNWNQELLGPVHWSRQSGATGVKIPVWTALAPSSVSARKPDYMTWQQLKCGGNWQKYSQGRVPQQSLGRQWDKYQKLGAHSRTVHPQVEVRNPSIPNSGRLCKLK